MVGKAMLLLDVKEAVNTRSTLPYPNFATYKNLSLFHSFKFFLKSQQKSTFDLKNQTIERIDFIKKNLNMHFISEEN
jgi:hypothetical protein